MRGIGWIGFLPVEAVVPMVIIGGFCIMIGQTQLAVLIFGTALALAIAPVVFDPIFAMLPLWATILILGIGLWTLLPRKRKSGK